MNENMENKGIDVQKYLDGWICFALFLRDVERKKLSTEIVNKNRKIKLCKHAVTSHFSLSMFPLRDVDDLNAQQ